MIYGRSQMAVDENQLETVPSGAVFFAYLWESKISIPQSGGHLIRPWEIPVRVTTVLQYYGLEKPGVHLHSGFVFIEWLS